MSDLAVELHWHRTEAVLEPGKYSAEHVVRYGDSHEVKVDAAPDWGAAGRGTPIPSRPSRRPCPAAT